MATADAAPVKSTPYGSGARFGAAEERELIATLRSQRLWSIDGGRVRALERRLAMLYGVAGAACCSSGTAAVHAALAAVGVEPGDEVVVPPIGDWGTIAGVLALGATPVFADVDGDDGAVAPAALATALSPRTRAVIVVHLAGLPARIAELAALCRARGVALIEDCAQTPWAAAGGARVGTFGDAAAFSANDSKHISCGEGGWVLCRDGETARIAGLFIDKAYDRAAARGRREVRFLGFNLRLSELHAAVLDAQLDRLEAIVRARERYARRLLAGLAGVDGVRALAPRPDATGSWWQVVARLAPTLARHRDAIAAELTAARVPAGTALAPSRLLYLNPALRDGTLWPRSRRARADLVGRYRAGMCPEAERLVDDALVLPCSESFTDRDADETAAAVRAVLARSR